MSLKRRRLSVERDAVPPRHKEQHDIPLPAKPGMHPAAAAGATSRSSNVSAGSNKVPALQTLL